MNGTVKWFNGKKGYGFVKGEDEQEYFIHYTQLEKGTFLRDDDPVVFDAVETDKGKQAQNIKKVGDGSSAPSEAAEEAPVEEVAEEAPAEEVAEEEKKEE